MSAPADRFASPMPAAAPVRRLLRDLAPLLPVFILLLAWDASGADMALMRLVGDPAGFAWREHWLLGEVLHGGAKLAAMAVALGLAAAVRWPPAALRGLAWRTRLWAALWPLAGVTLIALLKRGSGTSCPWSLAEFGGEVLRQGAHWPLWLSDGGPGHCFPSGHVATAFAFLGAGFAWREASPRLARAWWAAVLAAGLGFGLVQVLRGAHYPSHVLWTGWLCWLAAVLAWHASRRWREAGTPR
jgi:membrane-associated PAP2 superfamily phosphatase